MAKPKSWKEEVTKEDWSTFMKDGGEDDFIIVSRKKHGKSVAEIGHGTGVQTQYVVHHRLEQVLDRRVFIVDTPGFDDAYISSIEVLRRVGVWLADSYSSGQKIGGVIFLHDITQCSMPRSWKKVMRMFEKLCGKDAASKVLIMTTKWDCIPSQSYMGATREVELSYYWKAMLDRGSRMARYDGKQESAQRLIREFLERDAGSTQIQKEMVDGKKLTSSTKAGVALTSDLGGNSLIRKVLVAFGHDHY
ncbi:hypothetical protein DXG01_012704 [Tephrocybe rancida]|nr:hypothetical protein DXG01_012704 [Tephrocybe rancida]